MSGERIYAVGYRRLELRDRRRSPLWPMARTMLTLAWRRRSTKLALLFCLAVVFGHGMWLVGLLLSRRILGDAAVDLTLIVGRAQEVFSSFIAGQFFVTAIASGVIAGGAVAEDRAAGAFELYFARPLTRRQYALGKLLGAGLVPLATLVLPAFLLWITAVGIAPPGHRADLWWLAVPLITAALLAAATLTATVVGLSALGQKGRNVGVAYVAALVLLTAISEGLAAAGQTWAGYLAPERDLRTVADALLEVGLPSLGAQFLPRRAAANPGVLPSLLGLAAYVAAGLGALTWRLRREVEG